jgi:hypothetical protein
MKNKVIILSMLVMLVCITGCSSSTSSNLEEVAEYYYNSTLECKAFDEKIKYVLTPYNSLPITYVGNEYVLVTEENNVYLLNISQQYNSRDGNCKKIDKFTDDVMYESDVVYKSANKKILYNSDYKQIKFSSTDGVTKEEISGIDSFKLKILLKNNYSKTELLTENNYLVLKDDNNIYKATINYINIAIISISEDYDDNPLDIFLIPKDLYDGKLDVDFDAKDYVTHYTTGSGEKKYDADYKVIPYTDSYEWNFKGTNYVNNKYCSIYNLKYDDTEETYAIRSDATAQEYSIPFNKMTEEIVFSVPCDEKILDMNVSEDTLNGNKLDSPIADYILTDKSYYRYLLVDENCEEYLDTTCEYTFQKDEELSKIRNDILFRSNNVLLLKNGRLYYSA